MFLLEILLYVMNILEDYNICKPKQSVITYNPVNYSEYFLYDLEKKTIDSYI